MASKLVLVPEDIYRGLTTSDTGNINLDFARKALEGTKQQRINNNTKNLLYNQQLAKYLHLRGEHENKPTKVEFSKGLRALIRRADDSDEEEIAIEFNPTRPPHHHSSREVGRREPPPPPPSPPPASFSPTPPAPPRQPGAPVAPPAQPGAAPPPSRRRRAPV